MTACLLLFFRLFTWHCQLDGILALPTINHWLSCVHSVFAIGTDSSNPSTGRYVKQLKSRNGRIVWDGNHVIPYVIDKTLDPTMLRFIQSAQLHQTGMDTPIPIQTARECDLLKDADNMQLEQIRKLHEQGMSNRKTDNPSHYTAVD